MGFPTPFQYLPIHVPNTRYSTDHLPSSWELTKSSSPAVSPRTKLISGLSFDDVIDKRGDDKGEIISRKHCFLHTVMVS